MRSDSGCYSCIISQGERLMTRRNVSPDESQIMIKEVMKRLSQTDMDVPVPFLGRLNHEIMSRLLNSTDPYREIKESENNAAIELLPEMEKTIAAAKDPLEKSLEFAAMGNLIDHGTPGGRKTDIEKTLIPGEKDILQADAYISFHEALTPGTKLFFIGDNAGEIIFDTLMLKLLVDMNIEVTYAVRGKPILNDATRIDAAAAGIEKYARLVDTGDNTPGIDFSRSSEEFLTAASEADIVLAKGQGNFETLYDEEIAPFFKRGISVFFLFKIKCKRVESFTGIDMGKTGFIQRKL